MHAADEACSQLAVYIRTASLPHIHHKLLSSISLTMGDLRLFLLVCLPALTFAGLALEPNENGALTLFESDEEGDSDAVRNLFSMQKNVTFRGGAPLGLLVWVSASNGAVPPHAVSGGSDFQGEQLYVARIQLPSGPTPGKLPPSHGGAFASYGGLEIARTTYDVLTNPSGRALNWLPFGAAPPNGALLGGNDNVAGGLYVGRVRRPDGMYVSAKASYKYRLCYAPYGGKEESYSSCDILTLG